MDNLPQDYSSQTTAPKKSKLPLLIGAVILVLIIGGGFLLFGGSKPSEKPEVAAAITEAPTPTPTPTIDKESVKIQVLNGTSTPGQAGKVAVSLKNAGYNLDNIKTGNAEKDVSSSTIVAKSGFEGVAEDIKTALSSDFPDISVSTEPLSSDSEYDIVVTTGGEEYVAPTATPNPTGSDTPTPTPTGSDTPTPTPTNTPTPTPTPST